MKPNSKLLFSAPKKLLVTLASLGQRVSDLHLLRSDALDSPVAQFHSEGDNRVARTKRQGYTYDPKTERVYINQEQYFAPVPLEICEYQIGGYQVADKWLKDRKERKLDLDDIKTYCRIITALHHTIALQEEIDALYPDVEAEIVEIEE